MAEESFPVFISIAIHSIANHSLDSIQFSALKSGPTIPTQGLTGLVSATQSLAQCQCILPFTGVYETQCYRTNAVAVADARGCGPAARILDRGAVAAHAEGRRGR